MASRRLRLRRRLRCRSWSGEATYALPVGDVIDLKAEGARLQKEIKKLADEIGKIDAKLGNANFVSRAPEEVVEEQRERRAQAEQTRARLSAALERLGDLGLKRKN